MAQNVLRVKREEATRSSPLRRRADPELVEGDSAALAAALRRVLESLPDGGRALVVGHSPTNEAAVLGLAGEMVEPSSKGGGVLVVDEDGAVRVEKLD
jgi:phosphohistidine phosphatase SixA